MTSFCMSLLDLDVRHSIIQRNQVRTEETRACLQAPAPSLGSTDSARGHAAATASSTRSGPFDRTSLWLCTAMPHHRLKLFRTREPEKNQQRASSDDSVQAATGSGLHINESDESQLHLSSPVH